MSWFFHRHRHYTAVLRDTLVSRDGLLVKINTQHFIATLFNSVGTRDTLLATAGGATGDPWNATFTAAFGAGALRSLWSRIFGRSG